MRRTTAALLAASCLACFSDRTPVEPPATTECALPLDRVQQGDALVLIRGQRFLPDTVRVRPGQAVTWVNCEEAGSERHTSTAQGGAWDSPLLDAGAHYTRAFVAAGRFAYTCLPHPHMRGTVIVE